MEPTIHNGDTVLCDNKGYDKDDGIYAIIYSGKGFVKRLQPLADGVKIISDNPLYQPITEKCETEQFQIIGKVLMVMHKL